MDVSRQVVLELTRGHDAQMSGAAPHDGTEYLLRRGEGAYASARFPWTRVTPAELEVALGGQPGAQARQRVGQALRAFLEALGWSGLEAEIGQGACVTIRCNAAELCRLPLELLTLEPSGEALGLKEGCHVQWEWPGTETAARSPAPPEGGALLFAWSTAGGVVDAGGQLRAVQQAVERHRHPRRAEALPHASLETLRSALEAVRARGESVAALHLLCHGGPLPGAEGGHGLWLTSAGGEPQLVDPAAFVAALAPCAGLVGCVVLCACDGANLGGSANVLGSAAQRLHRAGFPAVVAPRAPLSGAGAEAFTRAFYDALLSGEPFHRAVASGRRALGVEWAALQVYARAKDGPQFPVVLRPYRGLQAFEERDQRFFFGQEGITRKLVQEVEGAATGGRPRFQVLAGSSGSGKSSLVKAGLIPALRRAGWRITALRPGGDGAVRERGLARLLRALRDLRGAPGPAEAASEEAVMEEARALRAQWPEPPVLVVVDQLEEALRLPGDEPRQFLGCLWRLAGDGALRVVVLSTFRADLMERAADLELEGRTTLQSVLYRQEHVRYVARMRPDELWDVIRRPLEMVGLSFEPGLDEQLRDEAGKEPGALPLLEHALDALWLAREGRVLTRAAYERLGGLSGALSRQLDQLWDRLPAEQQRQGRRLLVGLVDFADDVALSTRRRGWVEKLRPEGSEAAAAFDAVLERLVDQRLLVRGQVEEGEPEAGGWVEIAHEALIRRWQRLQQWLRDGHADEALLRELEKIAGDWSARRGHRERGESYLPAGSKLEELEGLARRVGSLSSDAARCLEAARAARARKVRRNRVTIAGLVAGVLALSLLSAAALFQWRTAARERSVAVHQRNVALSRELTSFVANNLEVGDPQLNLALLRRARELDDTEQLAPVLAQWARSPARAVMKGHSGPVSSAVFSPDGQQIVSASDDGTARIWSVAGELQATLAGHAGPVRAAVFSPDGQSVLTASDDGTARLWSVTGKSRATLAGHGGPVRTAVFSPDGQSVLTASDDGTARVWSVAGEPRATLSGHSGPVATAVFSPDGLRIVTAGRDGTARLWNGASGQFERTLAGHVGPLAMAAFSADGRQVATAGDDGVRIWDAVSGALQGSHPSRPHVSPLAAFSPDGTRFLSSGDGSWGWSLWDARTGKRLDQISGQVRTAMFSPDGLRIVTASDDGTARVFDAARGRDLRTFSGHESPVHAAAFSPDGQRVVTAGRDGTVRVWEIFCGDVGLSAPEDPVMAGAFSSDGQRALTASFLGTVRVWDAVSGRPLSTLADSSSSQLLRVAGFSPDGQRVATASYDETVRLWDTANGKLLATLPTPSDLVLSAVFSRDGSRLMSAGTSGNARIWDAADGRLLAEVPGDANSVRSFALSAEDQRFLTADRDGPARLWGAGGKLLATFTGHSREVKAAVLSPDGTRVLTTGEDFTARIWDATSGRCLATLSGHSEEISSSAFSPDGTRVVTASHDGTARVWDAVSGKVLVVFAGHYPSEVSVALFNPDGRVVLSGGYNGTTHAWNAATGKVLVSVPSGGGPRAVAAFSQDGLRLLTGGSGQAHIWRDLAWAPPAHREALLRTARALTPEEERTYLHVDD